MVDQGPKAQAEVAMDQARNDTDMNSGTNDQFQRSNGNRENGDQASDQSAGKVSTAERGGPDLDKAQKRQPPEATR